MEYGQLCEVQLEGLPKPGIYVGYNLYLKKHIILSRNPSDKGDIIPLQSDELKVGGSLTIDKALTNSELEFAINLLKQNNLWNKNETKKT